MRSRSLRVLVFASLSVAFALAASVLATGYLLLLGPLLLGAAHLLAEARVLLPAERRGSPIVVGLLLVQIALVFAGRAVVALPFVVAVAIFGLARGKMRVLGVAAALIVGVGTLVGPVVSRFVFLHVHNLVPLFVWAVARRRPRSVSVFVVALVALAIGLVMTGAFDAVPIHTPLADRVFSLVRLTDAVAGGFGGELRKRWLVVFAFTQSFHYAAWLRLVPEESRERETPRGFRASFAALQTDLGRVPVMVALLVIIAVPVAALLLGAVRARSYYVTASELHASVEALLVVVALVSSRAGRPFSNQ